MATDKAKTAAPIITMLHAHEIYEKDIHWAKHSFDVNDLVNKQTDAMLSYISSEPLILDDMKVKYKIFHPRDYDFDFYGDILFTSSDFIKKHPKLTKDFFDATLKGWRYAFNNIGKTATVIFQKYNTLYI